MRLAFALANSVVLLTLFRPESRGANLLTNEWSLEVRSSSDSAPAVGSDGTIYYGTHSGKLWAINPDGSRKWVFQAGDEIKSAPAVGSDGTIYFGSRDRYFYAVGPDGKQQWSFVTGGWVDSSPALAQDGSIYFGSWDKNLYALSADGKQRWHFSTPGEIASSPAIGTNGTIYFGSHDGKLYALSPGGHTNWHFTTGGPIISSPALSKAQGLYFTSVDGCLYALNLDGSLRWRLRTGGTTESSPVIGPDGTIYVGVIGNLWAISPEGKKKWGGVGGADFPIEASPVVLADGRICCISRYGMLCFVSPEGEMQQMYYTFGSGYASPAVGPTGNIYLPDYGRGSGALSGFGALTALRAGTSLAHTPWPRFRGNSRNTGNLQDSAQ